VNVIHIERDQVDGNGTPIEPSASWLAAAAAKTAEAIQEGPDHQVSDLYSDSRVRSALEKLFADKCAYCETQGVAGFEWDVEHFRPKGRVAEDQTHPGYYWLAYTWANLYLSCTLCNQRRKDKPRWDDPVEAAAAGKVDQFPLDPPDSRVADPGGVLADEGRLLIDPCEDEPEDHLSFTPKGLAIGRNNSPKAKASIKVYALNRKRLRDARLLKVHEVLAFIEALVNTGASDRARATSITLQVLSEPNKVYAGVARAIKRDPAAFGL
jgi:uncharacterized protein (TIGR02646 family)